MRKTISLATMLLLGMLCSQALEATCCNPNVVNIRTVPFHIDGTIYPSNTTYCITNNLTYVPEEGDPAAAITVDPGVHDIIIEFNNFDLYIDPTGNGIDMLGTVSEPIINVTIRNGTIKSLTPSGTNFGVNIANFNDVTVENMRFIDMAHGFRSVSQTDTNIDAKFLSCLFDLKGVTGAPRRGISLGTIQGLVVEDCTFLANDPDETDVGGIGILLTNNFKNGIIKRSTFDGQTASAIQAQSFFAPDEGFTFTFPSTNLLVDECEFTNNLNDLIALGTSNIQVTNSSFYGTLSGAIFDESSINSAGSLASPIPSGFLIDNCTFTSQGETPGEPPFGAVSFFAGSANLPGTNATDIIIRNSTFTQRLAAPLADQLVFVGVEGLLIENCVLDFTGTGRLPCCDPVTLAGAPHKSANIHLGYPLLSAESETWIGGNGVKDVIIRGNEICGGAQVGIFAETSNGTAANERITIEDNSITATEEGILFDNTHSSTIRNNKIAGVKGNDCKKGVGIKLNGALSYNHYAASSNNAIINNTVSNNSKGITLKCGAQGNLVKGNNVFNNSVHQIKESKPKTNTIVDNTTFSHTFKKLKCEDCSVSR